MSARDTARAAGPYQSAAVGGQDNVVVQAVGDGISVNVEGRAYLTLTRYLTRRVAGAEDMGGAAQGAPEPLELLAPYAQAVPLVGRDAVLSALEAWLASSRAIGVRLLTAPAGTGKTRVALALCDTAAQRGWDAGFATQRELERFWAAQNLGTWGWRRPTLVVIDYAAAKAGALRQWLSELAGNPGDPTRPLRVLLLERHADPEQGWWAEFAGRGGPDARALRRLLDPPEPVRLGPLAEPAERRAVFGAMLARLGRPDLGAVARDAALDAKLANLSWGGEPLFLLMAALTAVRAGLAAALALSPTEAAFEIADAERERIEKFAASGLTGVAAQGRRRFVAHLAACATLCQGLSTGEAEELVGDEKRALGRAGVGDEADLFELLARALPATPPVHVSPLHDAVAQECVAPVLPDVVGEAFVLRALGESEVGRAVAAVRRLAVWRVAWDRVVATVIRTAQDYGETAGIGWVPLAWLDALVDACGDDTERLASLVDQLPAHTLALREHAAALTARVAEARRAAGSGADTARWLGNLSVRLASLGRREEALAAGVEAVELYRELAAARPDAFRPDLAGLLNNLSNLLANLGRREEALAASEEAAELYRALADAHPDAFRPDLASSLNNLSNCLADLGRHKEALAVCEEAVALRRGLADARPDAFRPKLAGSLINLSNRLANLGRREEALGASREAAELHRELAAARPDAFRPDLATSLSNLSVGLADLGRHKEALAVCEEAVALRRALAAARPDAFRPNLAGSLNNLSNCLANLGRREEALAAGVEAVELYRELADARPDAFRPDLATSLSNLSVGLANLGRHEEALAASEEAAELYRALAEARPDAFRPDLAGSLNNLSVGLANLGRHEEALAASEEAAELYRALADAHPDAFRPDLAGSLNNLSNLLANLGRREEALDAVCEAIHTLLPHVRVLPSAFGAWMVTMARNYVKRCEEAGQVMDQALLDAIREALKGMSQTS